jgi:hypothetical protein
MNQPLEIQLLISRIPGTFWRHRNGNRYKVLKHTNKKSRRVQYPVNFIYRSDLGDEYNRPITDWDRSMTYLDYSWSFRLVLSTFLFFKRFFNGNL